MFGILFPLMVALAFPDMHECHRKQVCDKGQFTPAFLSPSCVSEGDDAIVVLKNVKFGYLDEDAVCNDIAENVTTGCEIDVSRFQFELGLQLMSARPQSYPYPIPAAANSAECQTNQTKPNYFVAYFDCINKTNAIKMCQAMENRAGQVFIWNEGYPDQGASPLPTQCNCFLETIADQLIVNTFDNRIVSGQNLTLSTSNGTVIKVWTSDEGKTGEHNILYTNSSDFVLTWSNNAPNANRTKDGKFWIEFKAAENVSGSVNIQCFVEIDATTEHTTIDETTAEDTNTQPSVTMTPVNKATVVTGNNTGAADKQTNTNNSMLIYIIGGSAGGLLILTIVIVCIVRAKRRNDDMTEIMIELPPVSNKTMQTGKTDRQPIHYLKSNIPSDVKRKEPYTEGHPPIKKDLNTREKKRDGDARTELNKQRITKHVASDENIKEKYKPDLTSTKGQNKTKDESRRRTKSNTNITGDSILDDKIVRNAEKTSATRNKTRTSAPRNEARTSAPRNEARRNEVRASEPKKEARTSAPSNEARTSTSRNEARTSASRNEARTSASRNEARTSAPRNEVRTSAQRNEARASASKAER